MSTGTVIAPSTTFPGSKGTAKATARVWYWLARGLALSALLVSLGAALRSLYPGVPWLLLARTSATGFAWSELEAAAEQFRKQGGGQLVSLVAQENYFSGKDSALFYLGRSREFRARLLILDFDQTPRPMQVRAFLNYRPVALGGETRALPASSRVLQEGKPRVMDIAIEDIPWGTSDLVVALSSDDDLTAPATTGVQRPLLPRRLFFFQIQRGVAGKPTRLTPAARSAPASGCKGDERTLLTRDSALAVVNCSKTEAEGVFFGSREPLFYRVPSSTVSVYASPMTSGVLHVSSPFVSTEDARGRPTFAQGDFSGT